MIKIRLTLGIPHITNLCISGQMCKKKQAWIADFAWYGDETPIPEIENPLFWFCFGL